MGFDKFGNISYAAETKLSDFVNFLRQGKVMATVCRKCGRTYFPPRMDCANCLSSEEMDWKQLSGKCRLITYSILHFAPTGFEKDVPYVLALVECEEGVNVFTRLSKSIKPDEIKVGMGLKLESIELPNGNISYEARKYEET